MRDLALQAAGALAIMFAMMHGVIGEWQLFPKAIIETKRVRALLRMVWQASTIDWIAIGALLIAAPALGSENARRWIIGAAVIVYGYAAVGNAIASRGRHLGWVLMSLVVIFSLAGL
ncbi:hypothetical protein AB4037_03475 [Labrys sp. KB_33_2]|uniref:hypothetical protein n=1 Tax=unclassified Labrys (in: a-proteobacteria) TaxID=2688601 RepID=UPI003EBC34EB